MKIIKKVSNIEVKRCFVISDLAKKKGTSGAKKIVLRMEEKRLDQIIGNKYSKRLHAYSNSDWFIAFVDTAESGVWKRAGELPLDWTNYTLAKTMQIIRKHTLFKFRLNRQRRAVLAIPEILKNKKTLSQNDKYLLPIGFESGTGTPVRKYLRKKVKVDIDDGCMRSIALALSGKKAIKMYVGFPKKHQ